MRTVERKPLLSVGDGRFLKVEQHVVEFDNGRRVDDWGWVVTPEFINVAPVHQGTQQIISGAKDWNATVVGTTPAYIAARAVVPQGRPELQR